MDLEDEMAELTIYILENIVKVADELNLDRDELFGNFTNMLSEMSEGGTLSQWKQNYEYVQ